MIDANLNEKININILKYLLKIIALIIIILTIIDIIPILKIDIFTNKTLLINYINKYGIKAPIIFIFSQITQIVIPFIPGSITNISGVLLFGPIKGFIYNYISTILGATIVYYLSKKYSFKLINKIFKKDTINKYINYFNNKNYQSIFLLAIILPFFPDDLLYYLISITKINFKRYIFLIIVGNFISLITYSILIYIILNTSIYTNCKFL